MPRPFFKDIDQKISEIIRVNHAGEFGAQRIYQGQIKYTKDPKDKEILQTMLNQEQEHLEYFADKIANHESRPTLLMPIWNMFGFALGAISAKMGIKTAMLVTEYVEEVIESHYDEQIKYLEQNAPKNPLLAKIKKFQKDEAEHRHIAIDSGSKEAAFARPLSLLVKQACKGAIFLSKKI
jgi:ubiquinone biosynthesis monooxygenase Coq7